MPKDLPHIRSPPPEENGKGGERTNPRRAARHAEAAAERSERKAEEEKPKPPRRRHGPRNGQTAPRTPRTPRTKEEEREKRRRTTHDPTRRQRRSTADHHSPENRFNIMTSAPRNGEDCNHQGLSLLRVTFHPQRSHHNVDPFPRKRQPTRRAPPPPSDPQRHATPRPTERNGRHDATARDPTGRRTEKRPTAGGGRGARQPS